MSNSKVIYISSDDQTPSESKSNSDFVCYVKENTSVQEVNYCYLKTATVPNVFYNVRGTDYGTAQNNVFTFQEQAPLATYAVTIPEGQYIINDLVTTLQGLMNGVLVSGTVAITIDPVTQKLIFTCTGTQISILSGNNGNLAFSIVGTSETTDTGFSAVINAPLIPDLAGLQNVYIQSSALAPAEGNDANFGSINILGAVNFSHTPFGGYGHLQSNDDELSAVNYKSTRNIQRIDISLVDKQGNKLPIGNSIMELTLKYFYD
jgi:hypothetical protein